MRKRLLETSGQLQLLEKAIPVQHTETTDASWDAGENVAAISNDEGASTMRQMFAWVDPDKDADTKAAYKFPHHMVSAGKVGAANTVACSAGIGVLNGGRGGADIPDADRQGVYDHLAAHLKDAGKDAPDLASATEAKRNFAKTAIARLGEAGRVLSAANEERLKGAVDAINEVLSQLESAPEDDSEDADAAATMESKRKAVEAWSGSAWDASSGAWLLASLIELMGEESDEPDQFAMLKTAFDSLNQWIAAEVAEIGTPDEDPDLSPFFDYEALRPRGIREAIGPVIALKEGAVRSDGSVRMKIIQPGWGSSGYYPAEVLERDGPKVFKAGTKNFWDHPTLTEEVDRPERSLRDLAGQLVSDAVYEADGPEGPGLYADAKVISEFAQPVNELAPFIGVSIRALGTAHNGSVDGQSGPIIDKLIAGESIDYVTTPGAGGQVLQLFEAARRREPITPKEDTADDMEALKEAQNKLAEKDKEIARLREVNLVRDAKEHIGQKLAEVEGMPDVTRTRLVESLARQAKTDKDGALDVKQLDEAIDKSVKDEADYLASATGSGSIRGFGSTGSKNSEAAEAELGGLFKSIGLSESEAKRAAKGRS